MFWAPKSELLGGFGALFGTLGVTLGTLGRFLEHGGFPEVLGAGFRGVRGSVSSPQTSQDQKDQITAWWAKFKNHE